MNTQTSRRPQQGLTVTKQLTLQQEAISVQKNVPIPISFFISSFPHGTIQLEMDKMVDGVLVTWTRGSKMEGADESTELWWNPMIILFYLHG